jgi:hypothetical protein
MTKWFSYRAVKRAEALAARGRHKGTAPIHQPEPNSPIAPCRHPCASKMYSVFAVRFRGRFPHYCPFTSGPKFKPWNARARCCMPLVTPKAPRHTLRGKACTVREP